MYVWSPCISVSNLQRVPELTFPSLVSNPETQLGMVVHACKSQLLRRLRQEGHDFEANLDYIARLSQKTTSQRFLGS
jgi:hypothetical protein